MAYLMDEIDEGATQRRMEEILSTGLRGLEECAERSAEIDREAAETAARQEAEIKEMERVRDEQRAAQQADSQPAAQPWPSRQPKPSVLSFDGEEFAAHAPTPPTGFAEPAAVIPPPPPEPGTEPAPSARPTTDHLLSFGADDSDEERPPSASPVPRPSPSPRPGRAAREDDDWSDTNWVR